MGLCVNFMSYLVIQVTSSLTMKVLGSVRNIFTIAMGVIVWGDVITGNAAMGYAITMSGFFAYNIAKSGKWERLQIPLVAMRVMPFLNTVQEKFDSLDQQRLLRHAESSTAQMNGDIPHGKGSKESSSDFQSDNVVSSAGKGGRGTMKEKDEASVPQSRQRKSSYTTGSYAAGRLPISSSERSPLLSVDGTANWSERDEENSIEAI